MHTCSFTYHILRPRFASDELSLATLYANAVKDGKIMSSEDMNTTNNKQTDIAAILEALSPENRGVIEERLVTMSKAAFAASEKLGPLEEQVSFSTVIGPPLYLTKILRSILCFNSSRL